MAARRAAAALAACAALAAGAVPASIILKNAANPGTVCPIAGLGTAGGGTDHGYGVWKVRRQDSRTVLHTRP